ncbi:MAG TPA: VWA domain-containing protein, partial [Pirellulales bacterium]
MSLVRQSLKACLAWLLFAAAVSTGGRSLTIAAETPSSPKAATSFESYAEADGRGFFALKLAPEIAQPTNQPHDVVVLFDTSASQMGVYRDKAFEALRTMLSGLSADDRVALLAVDVQAVKLTPAFTTATGGAINQALAALARRVPLGSTDMPAALNGALAAWSDGGDSPRARSVVYVGDGFSIASLVPVETLRGIVERYRNSRVSFSSYGIGPRVNAELLGALANHTGGMVVPDAEGTSARQMGNYLATVARGSVIWPTSVTYPAAIRLAFPRQMPPLRFDRDSVVLGTFDTQALAAHESLAVRCVP